MCLALLATPTRGQVTLFAPPTFPEFQGQNAGDGFGSSISRLGDVNGDGVRDLVIGGPGVEGAAPASGYIRVLSGADGSLLYRVEGLTADEAFGTAIVQLGDLDADGLPELAVGAPGRGSGSVYLLSGRDGAIWATLEGSFPGERHGASLVTIGDLDGDSWPDLVVGCPESSETTPRGGRVVIYSTRTLQTLWVFNGCGHDACLGASVASSGDLDGDGVDDLLVGAPGFSGFVPGGGALLAFSGRTGELIQYASESPSPDTRCPVTLVSDEVGAAYGSSLAGVGDIDGDNRGDFAVGSPGRNCVEVRSGASGSVLRQFAPGITGGFGSCLAAIGDYDGDRMQELLVGMPGLNFGGKSDCGGVLLYSLRSGERLLFLDGASAGDALGGFVAGLGDIDGDGLTEAAFGAPGNASGSIPGSVIVAVQSDWIPPVAGHQYARLGEVALLRFEFEGAVEDGTPYSIVLTDRPVSGPFDSAGGFNLSYWLGEAVNEFGMMGTLDGDDLYFAGGTGVVNEGGCEFEIRLPIDWEDTTTFFVQAVAGSSQQAFLSKSGVQSVLFGARLVPLNSMVRGGDGLANPVVRLYDLEEGRARDLDDLPPGFEVQVRTEEGITIAPDGTVHYDSSASASFEDCARSFTFCVIACDTAQPQACAVTCAWAYKDCWDWLNDRFAEDVTVFEYEAVFENLGSGHVFLTGSRVRFTKQAWPIRTLSATLETPFQDFPPANCSDIVLQPGNSIVAIIQHECTTCNPGWIHWYHSITGTPVFSGGEFQYPRLSITWGGGHCCGTGDLVPVTRNGSGWLWTVHVRKSLGFGDDCW